MITMGECEQLVGATETYRVERTKSTTDEDKLGEAGWKRYVERFMLEDYCDADMVPKKLYKGLWHWRRGVSREDYVRACREYVQTATGLIERRGKRMMREVVRRSLQTANERGI